MTASRTFRCGWPGRLRLHRMPLDPRSLDMQPHPEGGWYRETWRHARTVETPNGPRSLATCVAFLLQPGQHSAWHRVRSEELWLWQGGGPMPAG
jgi:predicted cupin superfamily sugar epimerase